MSEVFFITGGAGFIGSNIARKLVKENQQVKIFDDLSIGSKKNIEEIIKDVEFIQGDIRDLSLLKKSMKQIDYVLHHAAIASVQETINNPIRTNEINISGTLNVLTSARESNVKRVVFASSSAIYGDSPELPKKEPMKTNPISPYALHKLTGEAYCALFSNLFNLETVCLRYFNVFGPRQNPNSEYSAVIPKFINNPVPKIYGDGFQTRDFVFVEDVVNANLLACKSEKASGEVINIASGRSISLNELVKILNKTPLYENERKGEIKHSVADISKAENILGYAPQHPFEIGLKKTIDWFNKR